MLSELKAGSDYESLLRQEFKRVSQKEMIPKQQEEMFNIEDNLRLQQNLTKGNLSSIITGAPALVNTIIQEIINTDGDLIQFNKYFSTFRNALGPIKIRSLDDFNKLWTQFKTQQLGQQLVPTPEVIISTSLENVSDLEKMSTEDIDTLFRQAIEKKTGKNVSEINSIQYPLANGTLSNSLTLVKDGTIIQFDPVPTDNTEKSVQARINNVKLRYIYKAFNPNVSMAKVRIRWQKPLPVMVETQVGSTIPIPPPPPPKPKPASKPKGRPKKEPEPATSSGSGLGLNSLVLPQSGNTLDSHFALKKKRLGPTRYR